MAQEPQSAPPTPTQPPAELKTDVEVELRSEFKPEVETVVRKRTGLAEDRPGAPKLGVTRTRSAKTSENKTGDRKIRDTKGRQSKAKADKGKSEKAPRTAAAKTFETVVRSRKSKGKART